MAKSFRSIFNLKLNSSGMNIAYITVGLAIMSIVGMSAAYLVGDVKKQEVAGNAMGALNQAHILSLQKAKNTETVRNALTANGYDITKGSNLYKCLGGVGLACQGFCGSTCDAAHLEYKPIVNFVANTVIPGGLSVNSTASFAMFCNSNSCDYVSLKVKSQLSGGSSSSPFANIARESEFQLPGIFLTDRAQISFDCAKTGTNKIPTGIDLKKLGALCAGPQPTTEQCSGNPTAPVGQFLLTSSNPGCPATNNLDCSSTGVAAIGAMNATGARGYCVGQAPVVTTTTSAVTTTLSGGPTTTAMGTPTTVPCVPTGWTDTSCLRDGVRGTTNGCAYGERSDPSCTTTSPVITCPGGSAPNLASPDGTNFCDFTWSSGPVGSPLSYTATNGGTAWGFCQKNATWGYTAECPNKDPIVKTTVCNAGGRTVESPDGSNTCTFHWSWTSTINHVMNLTSEEPGSNGTATATCVEGGWTFSYNCPNRFTKSCPGGEAVLPSSSGGAACRVSYPNTSAGGSYSGSGSGGSTISGNCDNNGDWQNITWTCP